jgi:predicted ATPase/DNA-binding winged helix-turn-helix (wHTH) protein
MTGAPTGGRFRFEGFEVDLARRQMRHDGRPVALGARAFDVLAALLERRDRVVGKDELLALAWPGLVVEENNLTVQVSALRKALGPDAIATVAGRGYRFTLPAQDAATGSPPAGASPSATPTSPAPAASVTPSNLPATRSSFIGREQETASLRQLLGEHRLITLTGIGGSGKTRLALQIGTLELAAVPCRFPDGVHFVDLGPVADPELVAPTLAAACGLAPGDSPAGAARSFAERLASALAPRRALVLVDNCEHLLDATADLADTLLAGCPQLVLLATSREALGLEGEQVIQVASLAVPGADAPDVVTDAMRLFADRAHAAQAGFRLDAQTRPAVAEICRRLDGIPLAIEFAAARISHLSPAQVAERLGDRFRLLTGGRRRIARQQTLAAAMDWSHDLLGAPEQRLLRRLAVFAGGFRLPAAEAVCVDDPAQRHEVLDHLGSLVAQSLVIVDHDERGETRYRLLETVRLYALDKLDAAGETRRLRARHRDHHLAWLEAQPLERLLFDNHAIGEIGREIDNLRAAADWCIAEDRLDLLVRLVTCTAGYWFAGNAYRTAQQWLELALRDPSRLSVDEQVAAHGVRAWLCILSLDLRAAALHGDRGVELAAGRSSGFALVALSLRAFARSARSTWPGADPGLMAEARADAARAVEAARAGTSPLFQALAEYFAALVELHGGDFAAAAPWFSACMESASRADADSIYMLVSLSGLSVVRLLAGEVEAAAEAAMRFLSLLSASNRQGPLSEGWILEVVPALWAGGQRELAHQQLRRSARTMRRNGVDLAPNHFLSVAGVVEFLRGRPDRAARLLGAARGLGAIEEGAVRFRTPTALAMYLQTMPKLRAALGPAEARQARDEGRAMTLDEAFDYALAGLPPAEG